MQRETYAMEIKERPRAKGASLQKPFNPKNKKRRRYNSKRVKRIRIATLLLKAGIYGSKYSKISEFDFLSFLHKIMGLTEKRIQKN